MKTLRLGTTAPFQGFAELVGDAEGLFDAEGAKIEWIARTNTPREVDVNHPGIARLTVDDFRPSRIQLTAPEPIPEDELTRTYQWMRSWNMLDDVGEENLIGAVRQSKAHELLLAGR